MRRFRRITKEAPPWEGIYSRIADFTDPSLCRTLIAVGKIRVKNLKWNSVPSLLQ
jgi:hypothetical protein